MLRKLEDLSKKLRFEIIKMSHEGKVPHLGSSLSCIDIILALYNHFLRIDPNNPHDRLRDRFILSKGHAITSLYATLAEKRFFPRSWLKTFNHDESKLPEHPSPNCAPGIEMATGSLGHGLSVGIGQALAGKILKEDYRVVVLLSDGECNEGSIWEAAQFAPAHNLKNVSVFIDYNKWQATGRSNEIMQLSPLKEKWTAFGWNAWEIDGHDFSEILETFEKINKSTRPTAIIANTIKGRGISFMEDDNNWHYRIPSKKDLELAKAELL